MPAECVGHSNLVIFENESSFPSSFLIGNDVLHGEISTDGSKILCGFANNIQVVDVETQKTLVKHMVAGNINDTKFGDDGLIASVTNKNVLTIHASDRSKEIALPDEATAVAVNGDTAYVGTKKGSLLVVDIETGTIKTTLSIGSSKITKVSVNHAKTVVGVGSSNGLLTLVSVDSSKAVSDDLKYHNMPIYAIAFSQDDSLCLTGAHEKDVHLWDTVKMKHVDKFESVSRLSVNCIEAIDNNGFMCAGHDGSIKRFKY